MAPKPAKKTYKPGDTRKSKTGGTLRLSSTGKWFKSSNSKKANQQRDLNARLNAPIAAFETPQGVMASPVTERDLAHEAQAATNVKYGPQRSALANELGGAEAQRGGTNTWFNDYRAKLQAWQQQVQDAQAASVAAAQRLPGLVQGLGTQQQGVVQQQNAANQALTGGVANPELAQQAGQANQVAQSIGANWTGAAQNMADSRNNYASNFANVVAPQQQAVALQGADADIKKIRGKQSDLAGFEGDYNQTYRANRRTDENKTLIAEASLGLNAQKADASAKATADRIKIQQKSLQERTRAENRRHALAVKNANTSAERAAEVARHNKTMEGLKASGDKKKGKGPDWVTSQQQNEAGAAAARARSLAHELKVGHPTPQKDKDGKPIYPPGVKPGVKYSRQQAAAVLRQNPKMDEALLSAVLDAAYVGHLSPYTVRKLIGANYKPSQIASSLGVPTRKGMKKSKPRTPAQNIPGLGSTL